MNRYQYINDYVRPFLILSGSRWRLNKKGLEHYKNKFDPQSFETIKEIMVNRYEGTYQDGDVLKQGILWQYTYGSFHPEEILKYYEQV